MYYVITFFSGVIVGFATLAAYLAYCSVSAMSDSEDDTDFRSGQYFRTATTDRNGFAETTPDGNSDITFLNTKYNG